MRRRQQGLTLLEFALVVVIAGLLMGLAMTKILRLEADVERVNMQRTVSALNSALAMEFADRVVNGRLDTVPQMAAINPMDWLAQVPATYVGTLGPAEAEAVPEGRWYYDAQQGLLVYRVAHAARFETGLEGLPRARFRVEVVAHPRGGAPQGIRMVAAEPFAWK
jgi:general secretion pathway protein G